MNDLRFPSDCLFVVGLETSVYYAGEEVRDGMGFVVFGHSG